jgi:glycosyltransferase involved in cell wall biosynthesis
MLDMSTLVELHRGIPPRPLRVAYLTMNDPNDRRSWSGTQYYMARALERHGCEVCCLGPIQPFSLKIRKLIRHATRLMTGRQYLHAMSASRAVAKTAQHKLAGKHFDLIFAPAGSGVVAHLVTQIPIVYLSDATIELMVDYYPDFTNVLPSHLEEANRHEWLAIERSAAVIYPSSWAAESAVGYYHADRSKVHVVPFGANIDVNPSRHEVLMFPKSDRCRLLFVGVDWARKGGDIAFETLLELERLGVPADLTVVGSKPPQNLSHPRLEVFPMICKNEPGGQEHLDYLYKRSDFLLFPTRAECFGIVVCEANAYGLPVLSSRTGGVTELVREGINGFSFPPEARGDQYAAKISGLYRSPEAYRELRISSRDQFEKLLNWDAWAERMNEVFCQVVNMAKAADECLVINN